MKLSPDIRELVTEDKFTAMFIEERARLYCASAMSRLEMEINVRSIAPARAVLVA